MTAANITGLEYVSVETKLLHNVIATTIACLGCITNISTILAIIKTRLHREAAMLLVLNLIVLNLIPCVFTLPYISYLSFTHSMVSEPVDNTVCKIMGFLTYCIVGTEVIGLILVSMNRYILVVHFDKYEQIYKRRCNLAIMLVMSWSIYPVILIFPALEVWGEFKYDPYRFFCHPFNKDSFGSFLILFTGGVSLPLLTVCYIGMIYKVWTSRFKVNASRSNQQSIEMSTTIRRYKQELHLVISVILILTTFAMLYIPFLVISFLSKEDSIAEIISLYIAWTHCVVNALVYSLRNTHILKVYCCRN
ncbi:protein trapped in endoderm-1-like [Ylistrum balloti]|uniref:protein trapped in endoderm-1-like n=1 Tax=Ylistrum balloti TaxID=509963 RepID=UPI002905F4EE|nr:protein trapped in endoderm-1-like [Ylistrum balloti]